MVHFFLGCGRGGGGGQALVVSGLGFRVRSLGVGAWG